MHAQALAEAQRSIDLSPNFALGFFALGLVRVHIGHFREAHDPLLRSLRLTRTRLDRDADNKQKAKG
jgi:adenylate cyclase